MYRLFHDGHCDVTIESYSSRSSIRKFLKQCTKTSIFGTIYLLVASRAYSCLRPRNFGRSIPPLLQRHNVCRHTQVYREPRWTRCNPHDAIRTMQSARCNLYDAIRTMQSAQCNPHNTIRTMHMIQSAQCNPEANPCICTTAITAMIVTIGWLR